MAFEYRAVERELYLKTSNFTLWLDLTKDAVSQLNKMKKALGELNLSKGSFEYIDLRVANKIFYKRKK
jgi:hypothetical protein